MPPDPPFELRGLLQQAQEMQSRLQGVQAELERREVEAIVGGGLVRVRVNGQGRLLSVDIEPEAREDLPMLQDLIVAATNDALERAQQLARTETSRALGPLAGLLGRMGL